MNILKLPKNWDKLKEILQLDNQDKMYEVIGKSQGKLDTLRKI